MSGWTGEVSELAALALARFPDLNESEFKVVVAATTGEFAYCGPDPLAADPHPYPDPYNNPEYSDFCEREGCILLERVGSDG